MKLLFVHDHYFYEDSNGLYYSAGGFPFYLWEKYLIHFDEIIFVGRYGGKIGITENLVLSSHSRVEFVFVEKFSSIKSIYKIRLAKRKIRELVFKVDAVVVRLPSENGLIAFNSALNLNKACAIEVVGCAFDALWFYGGLVSKIYASVLFFRMKYALKKAKYALFVTEFYLQNKYLTNTNCLEVNASNVDISNFSDTVINNRINRLNSPLIDNEKIIIGIIGNFKTKYKGLHILIDALGILKKSGAIPNFQLRVLGKGNPDEYKTQLVKNNIQLEVEFQGTLANGSPVLEWIDNLDIYIQPSLTEGLPRSLIEAMSRGVVCLGSNAGGIPELLDDRFIFKKANAVILAKKIHEVSQLNSKSLRKIANNNFQFSKKYDSKVLSQRRFSFYESFKKSIK